MRLNPQEMKKGVFYMTQRTFFLSMMALVAVVLFVSPSFAKKWEDAEKGKALQKTMTDDHYNYFDINQILRWIANNGNGSFDPNTGVAGLYWPKGTAQTAVYEDGIVYGGYVTGGDLAAGTSQLRLIGSTYRQPFQAGKIIGVQNGKAVADNPALEKYRIFKIEKNFKQFATTDPAKYARLKKDYLEWPGDDGAPYIDRNGNGTFDAPTLDQNDEWSGGDEPLFVGDQMLFHVSNDANPSKTNFCYGSDPMGIEVRRLLWGSSLTGVMGNAWFERWTLINKGAYSIDSMYLGYWSDTDLGDGNDDFSGCDTVLQLGYTYNGASSDGVYGIPPADGYILLQGPLFPSSGDTAIFTWGQKSGATGNTVGFSFNKKPGYKNARMSSYAYYINRSSVYRDPQFNTTGATEFYRYLRGLIWDGRPFVNPKTVPPNITPFTLTGDPVAGTGWIDGVAAKMGDRRQLMSCGPFTMAPGDTQEIVIGFNISQGADYLNSVTLLKDAARTLHTVYDLEFNLPSPPPAPVVKVSELSDKIVLDWSDPVTSANTESFSFSILGISYDFQGYNIYQLPSATSSMSEAKKLTTFDLKDAIGIIINDEYNSQLGITQPKVSQVGTNSGIQRYYVIDKDYVNGGPLIKGKKYYYAVTAYSYNPNPPFGTKDLENPFTNSTVYMAIPQDAKPGAQHGSTPLQTIVTERLSGTATPTITAQVIDPKSVTGSNYRVVFHAPDTTAVLYYYAYADYATPLDSFLNVPNVTQWSVIRTSTGDTVIKRSTDFSANNSSPIADGIQFKVDGYPHFDQDKIIKEATYTPIANNNLAPTWTYDLFGIPFVKDGFMPTTAFADGFWIGAGANYGLPAYKDTFKVEIRFANPNDTINKVGWSKAYAYLARVYRGKPSHTDATTGKARSNNWWTVTNSTGGYLYEGYNDSPLQVWDVTNPAAPRQLNWAYWQVEALSGSVMDSIFATTDSVLISYRGLGSISTPDSSFHGNSGTDNTWNSPVYKVFAAGDTLNFQKFVPNPDRANRYTVRGTWDYRHGTMTIINAPYSTTVDPLWARSGHMGFFDALAQDASGLVVNADNKGPGMMPALYTGGFSSVSASRPAWNAGDVMTIYPSRPLTTATTFDFDAASIPSGAKTDDASLAKQDIAKINVFPNPYFGANPAELNKYQRFVTFTHMPNKATVRIFNLAGTLVRKLVKNDISQFFEWDLRNENGLPIASGMYIAYIDMENLGTKILKLAVIMEAQFLDRI
jgi:hypothetical protein